MLADPCQRADRTHSDRYRCYGWGFDLPLREVTVAELLKTRGYTTGHFGKWHVGGLPNADGISVPVALHLDHGSSLPSALRAINAGFTSVMIDASHAPVAENVDLANKVLSVARPRGVSVEAEIGWVRGNEAPVERRPGRIPLPEAPPEPGPVTTPEEAADFIARAHVDMLAISNGTVHGVFRHQIGMDYDSIRAIRARVDVPLVQHGTGGISLDDLTRLAAAGMSKINFGEGFRYDYVRHFLDVTENSEHLWHPWRIQREVKDRLRETMKQLIRALGSDGKA